MILKAYQIKAIIAVLIFIGGIFALIFSIILASNKLSERRLTNIREHIGETLIVSGDTLMVITYDFSDSKFVLSNDVKVSKDFLNVYEQLK